MTIYINGTTGISGADGSASTPVLQGTDTNTGTFFPAADTVAWATGGSERMRVDSSGNVGIGTSSPTRKLHVYGGSSGTRTMTVTGNASEAVEVGVNASNLAVVNAVAGGALAFTQNDAERARIDSSGNLLLNTTTAVSRLTIKQSSNAYSAGISFVSSSSSNYWSPLLDNATNWLYFGYNGSSMSYINNSTGNYVAVSDERVKKNIVGIDYGLSAVMALRPVKYHMVTDTEDQKKRIGLIAQEVKAVIDEAVDDTPSEDVMYGLDKSTLVPVLIKAIQEQQALITTLTAAIQELTARVQALEAQA
jgi:hypothetical protein